MKIFIVEDEHWSLLELEAQLEAYKTEHQVYPFSNPQDAILSLADNRPDLIITDIDMPGITGIELIKKVKAVDPNVNFVILSVHDDFRYAQQGIKLGVLDYITKPVKREDLVDVVDRSLAQIKQEQLERESKLHWNFNNMLRDNEKAANEFLDFQYEKYDVIYLLLGNWDGKMTWSSISFSNNQLLAFIIEDERLSSRAYCIKIDQQKKVMVLPGITDISEEKKRSRIDSLFNSLNKESIVHLCYQLEVSSKEISKVISQLEQSIEKNMLFAQSTLIDPDQPIHHIDLVDEWMIVRIIEGAIRERDRVKAKKYALSLLQAVHKKNISHRQLLTFVSNIYYAMTFNLQGQSDSNVQVETAELKIDYLREITILEDMFEFLVSMIDYFIEELSTDLIAPKKLIPYVLDWIHHHYQGQLKFRDFANEYHVSLSYLSREFKEQTGSTFSEYMMNYRVKKAKEYFNQGVQRTVEVSKLVGYEDDKYFQTVFKRVEGISPAQYKNKIKKSKS